MQFNLMKRNLMTITSKNHDGIVCTLVNVKTGQPVKVGDDANLRDEPGFVISGGRAPHKPGSTGRVWVQDKRNGSEREFFPGVVDAQWMPAP
jgi:hypothetical protein